MLAYPLVLHPFKSTDYLGNRLVSITIHNRKECRCIMAGTYRKKRDSDTWHFCSNCSNWPTSDYIELTEKPAWGELCNECQAKKVAGNCS